MRHRVFVVLLLASGSARAAPSAATTLVETFAPELVGKVIPAPAVTGDWAMSLDLGFDTYPTTEMHISENRKAAMRMTLAPSGTVRACVGMVEHHVTNGQYHYKPAGQRERSERESARLLGLAGTWRTVDGVTAIDLDTIVWNTCDLATGSKLPTPYAQLRCVGSVANPTLPAATLLCEVAEHQQLLGLGLPMTPASRAKTPERFERAPHGTQLLLGAPGLVVKVEQHRTAMLAFTFKTDAVTIVEKDFQPKPPPKPPRPPHPPRPVPKPLTP
jgi:hypothetical protein